MLFQPSKTVCFIENSLYLPIVVRNKESIVTHRPPILAILLFALFAGSFLVQAQESQVPRMKLMYEQKLETSYNAFNTSLIQLRVKYVQGLDKLQAGFQKAGKLEDLLACKTELERFNEAQTVQPEHLKAAPAELARIQKAYVDYVAAKKATYAKEVVDVSKAYVTGLDKAVVEYTRSNRLEDALLARKERDETATGKLVTWAAEQTREMFFLKGILDDPTPEQYGLVLEIAAKDLCIMSVGYNVNKDKKAPNAHLYRGAKKLMDKPSQGLNIYAMTPKGEPLLDRWVNQKTDREGDHFAKAVNDLDDGSVVVLVIDEYVHTGYRPKLLDTTLEIGCAQFEDVPKGGAYYCIGIKGLAVGKALEGYGDERAAYPDVDSVTTFLDAINGTGTPPSTAAAQRITPPSRVIPTPPRRSSLARPGRTTKGFRSQRIGQ